MEATLKTIVGKGSRSMRHAVCRFDEGKFYWFALAMGVANVARNGLQLGLKKSIGKIFQPVNSFTRFPEYHFMESRIRSRVQALGSAGRPRILDVSSPKCFGLYLAYRLDAEVHMTDIDGPSIREAEVLWNGIKERARGKALFSIQDARSLKFPNEQFDIVYSMSVVEHVAGSAGDSEAIREMVRVLKPGGLLLATVPAGEQYIEQEIIGFEGAARSTGDQRLCFFQRIYTPAAATERLIDCSSNIRLRDAVTVTRNDGVVAKYYYKLGMNARGLLGFLNPILSTAINRTTEGVVTAPSKYGRLHTLKDLYGDFALSWDKSPHDDTGSGSGAASGRKSEVA